MELEQILSELSKSTAVSGYEESLAKVVKSYFSEYCSHVEIDHFYNVIGILKSEKENALKVMITAHIDEIGLIVTSIEKNGFLRVSNVGGVDPAIMLAQEVTIHGNKDIFGIIGAKPPHLLKTEDSKKAIKLKDLCIDTGYTSEEIRELVNIGDLVTFRSEPLKLQNNKISAKAMDNRAGVATMITAMKMLKNVKHSCDIYFVCTSQEELHLAGVTAAAYTLKPDIAIVVDACHGDMVDGPKDDTYPLGKGPAIGVGPLLQKRLSKAFMDIAREEGIGYQKDIEASDTGTEVWATQVSRSGIPTALLSIPVRYMHTPIEVVNLEDIASTARLVTRFIERFSSDKIELKTIVK